MSSLTGQELDHYVLIEQIGQGGMATVYLGTDTRNGDKVAIKVLSPTISGDKRFVRRFRREGGLVQQLRHPNIIPVSDYGEDDGLVYLTMPYIEGETLDDIYRRGGATQEQAARWISQVANALHYAHEQGVIHRDVKPGNVIVDKNERAHLGDFGLARWIEGSSTLTGSMLMGTPAYMSPEQARGEKLDARSDQYSLGVIIFQLFTGRLPFKGESPMQTAMMHLQQPVPRPAEINTDLPSALERVILTALSKDPEERFPSTQALNTAFQAALRGDSLDWLQPTELLERPEGVDALGGRDLVGDQEGQSVGWRVWGGLLIGLFALLGLFFVWSRGGVAALTPPATATSPARVVATSSSATAASEVEPTSTSPPTPAPPIVSDECPGLQIYGFSTEGNEAHWLVDNGTDRPLTLENLEDFSAPGSNQAVQSVTLGQETLFVGPATDGLFSWAEGADRVVESGEVERITFRFAWQAAPTDYAMTLVFSGGCRLAGEW